MSKAHIQIAIFLLLFFVVSELHCAEIYAHVDEEGTLHFSNTVPPADKKAITLSGKSVETEEQREDRIREKRAQTELKYLDKKEKIEKDREERIEQRERNRKADVRNVKFREREQKIRAEKVSLEQRQKNWIDKCERFKKHYGYVLFSQCEDRVEKRFKQLRDLLATSPEYYFDYDYKLERETRRSLDDWYDPYF